MDPDAPIDSAPLSPFRAVLSFILVGLSWGLTTPFIRRAAVSFNPTPRDVLQDPSLSWWRFKLYKAFFTVIDMLRTPAYLLPLVINLTGSVWFFLLIGKAELSLTVPITNSLAFLFTVLGEWWAEGKVISRDTWIGMLFSLGGIALCVQSKNR